MKDKFKVFFIFCMVYLFIFVNFNAKGEELALQSTLPKDDKLEKILYLSLRYFNFFIL